MANVIIPTTHEDLNYNVSIIKTNIQSNNSIISCSWELNPYRGTILNVTENISEPLNPSPPYDYYSQINVLIPDSIEASAKSFIERTIDGNITDNSRIIPKYFYACTSIFNINASEAEEVGEEAFFKCSNLFTANLSNCSIVKSKAFEACINLSSINLLNCEEIKNYAFRNCIKLSEISCSSLSKMGEGAFSGCTSLTTVIFPALIINIYNNFNSIFSNCNNLSYLEMGFLSGVNGVFFSNFKLQKLKINRAKSLDNFSYYCPQLSEIELDESNGNYILEDIGVRAFENMKNLKKIKGLSKVIENIREHAFYNARNLTFFNGESNENHLILNCKRIESGAFESTNMQKLTLNNTNLIDLFAFQNCINLENINFNNIHGIWDHAFEHCVKLKNITFSSNNNNNVVIHANAFYGCSMLSSVYIYYPEMIQLSNSNAFTDTKIKKTYGRIYVPESLIETYRNDSIWGYFKTRFSKLNDWEG